MSVALISATDLERQRRGGRYDPVVIDARRAHDYDHAHMPGAIRLDWTDWCNPAPAEARTVIRRPGYWGVLAERPTGWYAERLSAGGISSDRAIVVYADGPRSKGRDGRIAWMLLYLGARSVSLLDGGWQAWLQIGGVTERTVPEFERGEFVVDLQSQRRCTRSDLIGRDGRSIRPVLVDTRTPEEFEGQIYQYQPRMGHLPQAISMPFTDLFHPSGLYIDAIVYEQRAPIEVRTATHLVAYCEVGVRACTFALLHEVYTGKAAQVYDGSIMEWSLDPRLSVEAAG